MSSEYNLNKAALTAVATTVGTAYASKDPIIGIAALAGACYFDVNGVGKWLSDTTGIDLRKADSIIGTDPTPNPDPDPDPNPDPDPDPGGRLTPGDVVDAESCYNYILDHYNSIGVPDWTGIPSPSAMVYFEVSNNFTGDALQIKILLKHPTIDEFYLTSIGSVKQLFEGVGLDYLVMNKDKTILFASTYQPAFAKYGFSDFVDFIVTTFGLITNPSASVINLPAIDINNPDPDPDPEPEPVVYDSALDCLNYYTALGRIPGRSESIYDPLGTLRFSMSSVTGSFDPTRTASIAIKHPVKELWFMCDFSYALAMFDLFASFFFIAPNGSVPRRMSRSEVDEMCSMSYNKTFIPFIRDQQSSQSVVLPSDESIPFEVWYDMNLLTTNVIPAVQTGYPSEYSPFGVTMVYKELDSMCDPWTDILADCQRTRTCYASGELKFVEGIWPYGMRDQAWEARALTIDEVCRNLWKGYKLFSHSTSTILPVVTELNKLFNLSLYGSSISYRANASDLKNTKTIANYSTFEVVPMDNCTPR